MGLLNDPGRAERARMEQAERASPQSREAAAPSGDGTAQPSRPKRYKLYDRISDKVSVSTMNVIIGATALLLILALIIGIATGNPR